MLCHVHGGALLLLQCLDPPALLADELHRTGIAIMLVSVMLAGVVALVGTC